MPDRWSTTAYACLMVALYVAGPSHIELTVQDHVRVDRLTSTGAERHGELLPPGTAPLYLTEGTYIFRTTRDADVRLLDGAAVRVEVMNQAGKDQWPDPKIGGALPDIQGDAAPDLVPTLAVRA
jgi:hypothetical protein